MAIQFTPAPRACYLRRDVSAPTPDPNRSSITQLRKQLEELEVWQLAFDRGEADAAPDQELLRQIRAILGRRDRPTDEI